MKTVKVVDKSKFGLPEYKTPGSSGFDFHANLTEDLTLLPGEWKLIPTGLFFEIPVGYEIQVRPRSGLAVKYGVFVLNSPGTIDSDYRGEVCIILANFGSQPFLIQPGDRIAQGVLSSYEVAEFEVVSILGDEFNRGGGFGSTGVK